tara:strand:+ start:6155 stop:7219 length:1065 start_codon:yes stop_codon:yes gene_type:complete
MYNRNQKNVTEQSGVALIVVLMMVAIISSVAVQISSRTQFAMARSMNQTAYDQSYWYALSAERQIVNLLLMELKRSEVVHLGQVWAEGRNEPIPLPMYSAEGITVSVQLSDLQSFFNVNVFAKKAQGSTSGTSTPQSNSSLDKKSDFDKIYAHLLMALGLDQTDAERLRDLLADFIDADGQMRDAGAESENYAAKPVPYKARNGLLSEISELRSVIGYNQRVFQGVKPFVYALPTADSKINVNTIDKMHAPLLRAILAKDLLDDVGLSDVLNLIEKRPEKGWQKVDDFIKDMKDKLDTTTVRDDASLKKIVDVKSEYFLLRIQVLTYERSFILNSLLHYKNKKSIDVLRRQFGG